MGVANSATLDSASRWLTAYLRPAIERVYNLMSILFGAKAPQAPWKCD